MARKKEDNALVEHRVERLVQLFEDTLDTMRWLDREFTCIRKTSAYAHGFYFVRGTGNVLYLRGDGAKSTDQNAHINGVVTNVHDLLQTTGHPAFVTNDEDVLMLRKRDMFGSEFKSLESFTVPYEPLILQYVVGQAIPELNRWKERE